MTGPFRDNERPPAPPPPPRLSLRRALGVVVWALLRRRDDDEWDEPFLLFLPQASWAIAFGALLVGQQVQKGPAASVWYAASAISALVALAGLLRPVLQAAMFLDRRESARWWRERLTGTGEEG